MIAAVAVSGFGDFRGRSLEVGAGQVVEEHFVFDAEEILPAFLQMGEQGISVSQELIQDVVKLVFAAPLQALRQQVFHGALVIPLSMEPPLTAGRHQAIDDRNFQQAGPVRAFARDAQLRAPERVEVQTPPQLAPQPAGPILAGARQFVLIEPDLQSRRREAGRQRMVTGEQAEGLLGVVLRVEYLDGFGPLGLLLAVDLSQVKQRALVRARARAATHAFHHAVVAVLFAIFLSSRGAQEHGRSGDK